MIYTKEAGMCLYIHQIVGWKYGEKETRYEWPKKEVKQYLEVGQRI